MGFRTTSTRPASSCLSAFTLVEMMVGMFIGFLIFIVVGALVLYSGRSFAALTNYVDLDASSRNALDTMTSDVRQANRLTSFDSNTLVFEDFDGGPLIYTYSPQDRTLVRTKGGIRKVLLTGCDQLVFTTYQRNPINGTYEQYPTATAATCKLINISWVCSRSILGGRLNTESVQTAKIVIRKQ